MANYDLFVKDGEYYHRTRDGYDMPLDCEVIDASEFSRELTRMLDHYADIIGDEMAVAVRNACKVGAKQVKADAIEKAQVVMTGKYAKGISYKVKRGSKDVVNGYVGNRLKPGLAHLLEYGHAKLAGSRAMGKVPGFPHYEEAGQEMIDVFQREIDAAIERVLES